jgi:hypothetical protein
MKANLDNTVEIEVENRLCYHLRVESRAVHPARPLDPVIRKRILCLRQIDYKKYFQCSAEDQVGYLKAMNIRNCELVHDPSLEDSVRIERPKSAEEEFILAKKIGSAVTSPITRKTKKAVK